MQSGASTYYIHGCADHLKGKTLEMLGIVAAASFGPDNVLEVMLSDDRVPALVCQIEAELVDEMQLVPGNSGAVWSVLAEATGVEPCNLRSAAISASVTVAGFICDKVHDAKCHTLSLAQGNVLAT